MFKRKRNFIAVFIGILVAACQSAPVDTSSNELQQLEYRASAGDMQAQLELASELEYGSTNALDIDSALHWYRAAADNGSTEGAYRAAELLADRGPAYEADVRSLLEFAANADFAPAQLKLADIIIAENPKNPATAQRVFILYLSAARQDLASAQFKTASLLLNGQGVEKNLDTAIAWFRRAAGQGDARAQLALGNIYLTGTGVPANVAQAVEWYEQSANQGSIQAQSNLGDLLTMDRYGSLRDMASGARWYQSSAEQNHAHAQSRLGMLYEDGTGVAHDLPLAARWYLAAAEQGNASAQCRLGSLYLRGSGLSQDSVEAELWFSRAAAQVPAGVLSLLGFLYYDCDQFDTHEVTLNIAES